MASRHLSSPWNGSGTYCKYLLMMNRFHRMAKHLSHMPSTCALKTHVTYWTNHHKKPQHVVKTRTSWKMPNFALKKNCEGLAATYFLVTSVKGVALIIPKNLGAFAASSATIWLQLPVQFVVLSRPTPSLFVELRTIFLHLVWFEVLVFFFLQGTCPRGFAPNPSYPQSSGGTLTWESDGKCFCVQSQIHTEAPESHLYTYTYVYIDNRYIHSFICLESIHWILTLSCQVLSIRVNKWLSIFRCLATKEMASGFVILWSLLISVKSIISLTIFPLFINDYMSTEIPSYPLLSHGISLWPIMSKNILIYHWLHYILWSCL